MAKFSIGEIIRTGKGYELDWHDEGYFPHIQTREYNLNLRSNAHKGY